MPRVQYIITDGNGTNRGSVSMRIPKRVAMITEWLKQASKAIKYDFSEWQTFKSYASTDVVYYDLRNPRYEFRATLVIDRNAE